MATSTAINIITGRTGTAHVSSSDDAAIWRGFVGNDNVTLSTDQQLALDYSTKGSLTVSDGVLCIGGRMGRISNTSTVTYNLPSSGYYRRTLLIVRYAFDSSNDTESMTLMVLQNDPASDTSGSGGAAAAAELTIDTNPSTDYILYDFVCDEDGVVGGTMSNKMIFINAIPALNALYTLLNGRVSSVESGLTDEATARANADTALGSRITPLETWKNAEDTSCKLVKITPPGSLHTGNQYIICEPGGGGTYAVVSSLGDLYYYTVSYNGGTSVSVTFRSDTSVVSGGSATIIGSVKIIPA